MPIENAPANPPATGDGSEPVQPPVTGEPAAATGDGGDDLDQITDVDALRERIRQQRKWEARVKSERTPLEQEVASLREFKRTTELAGKTPDEQANARIADLEKNLADANAELTRTKDQYKQERVEGQIRVASQSLGIVDPEAAFRLLDQSTLEIDDDGKVKNAEKALRDLVKAKPYLLGGGRGSADGGAAGSAGSPKTSMNDILRDAAGRRSHQREVIPAREG